MSAALNPNYPSMQRYLATHTSCPTCHQNDVHIADLIMNPNTQKEMCPDCQEENKSK